MMRSRNDSEWEVREAWAWLMKGVSGGGGGVRPPRPPPLRNVENISDGDVLGLIPEGYDGK